jgi:hypothetical protein
MMQRLLILTLLAMISAAICGCHRTKSAQPFTAPVRLSPADQDAAEPALAPGPEGGAFIAWVAHRESTGDVMVARLNRAGEVVSQPARVNPTAGMATAWRGDPPSLAVAPDGTVYVVWTARTATADGKKATDVMFSVSNDGGQTFAAPLRVNDDSVPSDHGMHSLAVNADGRVFVAWLDGRNPQPDIDMPETPSGMNHNMPADQKMQHHEGNREIFTAYSTDTGKSFSPNLRVAGQVCPCCKTSLSVGPDGRVFVSWRQVLPGSFRHIAVASSTDGAATFGPAVIVSDDAWRLAACPVSGAALDANADGRLHVMWYAAGDAGEAGYYQTWSGDHGKTFQPRQMFAAGSGRGTPYFNVVSSGPGLGVWEGGDGAAAGIQFGWMSSSEKEPALVTRVGDGTTPAAIRSEGQIFVALVVKQGDKRGIMLSRTTL